MDMFKITHHIDMQRNKMFGIQDTLSQKYIQEFRFNDFLKNTN